MSKIASIVVGFVALIHTYIAWFEIFAWQSRGPRVFSSFPAELFAPTTPMAANQGLYNGFLAAGLFWSLLIRDAKWQRNIATCFLIFVAVAGVFGAFTADIKTLYVQLVPASIGIACVWLVNPRTA
ncbi:MAG: DUF1304 domain-containing protein [Pseudomonadota bacterium]